MIVSCVRCAERFERAEPIPGFPICDACYEKRKHLPHPIFCTAPERCAGHSNCQREMCCAD